MLRQIFKFKEAIVYTILIFVAFVWLLMQIIPQTADLIRTEKKINKKTVELERVNAKLAQMKKELQEKKKSETDMLKKVYKPEIKFDTTDMEYVLMVDDIINMVKNNGLKVYALDYNYNVATDEIVTQSVGKYLGCQLTFSLIGDYAKIRDLLMDLIKYPYLITLNSVEVEPYAKDNKTLLTLIKITLYSEQ